VERYFKTENIQARFYDFFSELFHIFDLQKPSGCFQEKFKRQYLFQRYLTKTNSKAFSKLNVFYRCLGKVLRIFAALM
jgi:hypothetical protein